jgi:hypothetical protein
LWRTTLRLALGWSRHLRLLGFLDKLVSYFLLWPARHLGLSGIADFFPTLYFIEHNRERNRVTGAFVVLHH